MANRENVAGHAFISYVREDSHRVDWLQVALETAGIPVWRDTANLWPGENWRANIRRAITNDALVFVACFSQLSLGRHQSYQNEELLLATEQLRRRRPEEPWLIPVRFDECVIPDYDIGGRTFASIQCADLFGDNAEEGMARLVEAILRILQRDSGAETGLACIGPTRGAAQAAIPTQNLDPPDRVHAIRLRQADRITGSIVDQSPPGMDSDRRYAWDQIRDQIAARLQRIPLRETGSAYPIHLAREIGLWGPPASGKTCFLAALNTAVAQASPAWSIAGADEASTAKLSELTASMVRRREFPLATQGIEGFLWVMTGELEFNVRRGIRHRRGRVPVQLDLSILDVGGEAFFDANMDMSFSNDMVDNLAACDGIIFFFDPEREAACGDAIEHFQKAVARLEQRLQISGGLDGSRLPHHLAVCVAKFDEPSVFDAAKEGGHLVMRPDDRHMLPRVADERAEDFFKQLCRRSSTGSSSLLYHAIKRYFHPARTRYFAVSSVGFYLNPSMHFDIDDYYNLAPTPAHARRPMLRGDIYPINVLEPFIWLAAPGGYDLTARSLRPSPFRFDVALPELRSDHPSWPESVVAASAETNLRQPVHLIFALEVSGAAAQVEERLSRVEQLIGFIAAHRRQLIVSLISYGPHSFYPMLPEEPPRVLAWASTSETALSALRELYDRGPTETGYPWAAQIECVLSEIADRLTECQERPVLVTVGSRVAFPERMNPVLKILPCPARKDWRQAIQRLRKHPGAAFGAIHDQGEEEIWTQLGMDALAHIGSVNPPRFAAELGLLI
jgi:TIR domain